MSTPESHRPPPGSGPTSGFAIASFVLGLLGGVPLSVIFGLIALSRIKKRGLRGRGFAIAGLVLSGLWVVVIGVVIVLAVASGAERDASGRITEAGSVSTLTLRKGDCIENFEEGIALSVDAVPCEQLHDGEVISNERLSGDAWPGLAKVDQEADRRCTEAIDRLPPSAGDPQAYFFRPTEETWEQKHDRSISCVAVLRSPRRGSL